MKKEKKKENLREMSTLYAKYHSSGLSHEEYQRMITLRIILETDEGGV